MNTPRATTTPQPPGHPTSPGESADPAELGTILAGYGLVLVLLFGRYAAPLDAWNSKEASALHWLAVQSWTPLSDAAGVIARLFSHSAALVVLLGAGAIVALVRGARQAVISVLIATTGWLGGWFVAIIVHRPEPGPATALVASELAGVYPDGQTVLATSVVAAIVTALGPSRRLWSVPAGALLVGITGTAKLQLGATYPTDVLAAVVLAVSWSRLAAAALASPPGARLVAFCRLTTPARSARRQDKTP